MLTKGLGRTTKRAARPSFTELDRITVREIGTMVLVDLDRDTQDFNHLLGRKIVINGRMEYASPSNALLMAPPGSAGASPSAHPEGERPAYQSCGQH